MLERTRGDELDFEGVLEEQRLMQALAPEVRRLDELGHVMRAAAGSDEPEQAASMGASLPEQDHQCAPPLRLVR